MDNTRKKLIELLGNMHCRDFVTESCGACKYGDEDMCQTHAFADHLIANGVTFATDNNVGDKRKG